MYKLLFQYNQCDVEANKEEGYQFIWTKLDYREDNIKVEEANDTIIIEE